VNILQYSFIGFFELVYFMARKKIFIYLSLVVSAITFLTSTGRAQGRPQSTVNRETQTRIPVYTRAPATRPQLKTPAFSLQKSDGVDKTDMEKAIRRSREEQAQKQEQDLNQAIALSREDTELQQAIALSLKEQELQKARESQLGFIPKTGLTNKDFKERLSEIEARRITGKSFKTFGRYNVLDTTGDGFCGLHCLGIVPHDALALINQACNQRNLDGNQIASLTNAKNAITQLHANKKSDNWLELDHVKTMANLVLQKQIRFHYDGADIGHQDTVKRFNDDTDPYNGTIWVHFSGNHYSKMVEK